MTAKELIRKINGCRIASDNPDELGVNLVEKFARQIQIETMERAVCIVDLHPSEAINKEGDIIPVNNPALAVLKRELQTLRLK